MPLADHKFVARRLARGRSTRRLALTLFAAHLLVLAVLDVKTISHLTGDSGHYLSLAESIRSGRGYGLGGGTLFEPEAIRMPGYPVFLFVCQTLSGSDVWGAVVVQHVLFLASVWLVWRVTERTFGSRCGLIFLALSAAYPFIAYSAGQISPEIVTVFLISLAFYLMLEPTPPRFFVAGLALAAATYFRPNLLLLPAALAPACVLADRRLWLKAALLPLVSACALLPWAIHNYETFGSFTPISVVRGSGNGLFIATWESRVSTESLVDYGTTGRASVELQRSGMLDQVSEINRRVGVPPETLCVNMEFYTPNEQKREAEKLFTQRGLDNIRAEPGAYLRHTLTNTLRMWFSAHPSRSIDLWARLGLIVEGVLFLLFGIGGAYLAVRRAGAPQRLVTYAAVSALLYFSYTLCWFHLEARYTISARLLLVMFAAHAIDRSRGLARSAPRLHEG